MAAAPSGSYALIFGPVFWGFCLSLILCGVSAVQGYLYFTRYNDKLAVRLLATMMLLLDFLSMALICQSMYYYMLPHFGSFTPLYAVTKELILECLISAVITFTSQMYFVYQLYMVKSPGRLPIAMNAVVAALGTIGLGGAIGCVVLMFQYPHSVFMDRNPTFAVLAGVAKGFGAGADIIATIAMCMFLKSANTGITRTSSLLRSLKHLFINRGILVTAAQILLLLTFFASAGRLYWLAVHINTTKLYVNTFFGMLNARTALQEKYSTGHMSLSTENTGGVGVNAGTGARRASAFNLGVRSDTTKVGDLEAQEYALGAIRVTTTSAISEI